MPRSALLVPNKHADRFLSFAGSFPVDLLLRFLPSQNRSIVSGWMDEGWCPTDRHPFCPSPDDRSQYLLSRQALIVALPICRGFFLPYLSWRKQRGGSQNSWLNQPTPGARMWVLPGYSRVLRSYFQLNNSTFYSACTYFNSLVSRSCRIKEC